MYRCVDGKFRYIYKITCLEGSWKGKFYYGKHTTDYLADGYFSSGILINKYKKKYPHGYIKEIISFHNSDDSLNKAEYDIIHPYLGTEKCLNLKEGGKGGGIKGLLPWNTGKKGCFSNDTISKMRESHINKPNPKLSLYRKGNFTGMKVVQGTDAGFIKFGSRVDLYFPIGTKIEVALDQKAVGNKTVIAQK